MLFECTSFVELAQVHFVAGLFKCQFLQTRCSVFQEAKSQEFAIEASKLTRTFE